MQTLGQTTSVCSLCRTLVPAKIVSDGSAVYFDKFCGKHGPQRVFVYADSAAYLAAQSFVKPAWIPRQFAGQAQKACPEGCGVCERHEQHLCLPLVEITSRCNLACPICLVSAGGSAGKDLSLPEFEGILKTLIATERQIDVLNLSGGEPLLHPRLLELIDAALAHPEIVRVSISTNGLHLLTHPALAPELRSRNVVISLQCDGFSERAYQVLRGQPLLPAKRRILELLGATGLSTSLTMTLAGGVNEDQLGPVLDYFFTQQHVISLMLQPLAYTGRAAQMRPEGPQPLTIPEVVRLLGAAGNPHVTVADFLPLPCSHPLCFSLAYYLILDTGSAVSINRLVDAGTLLDSLANRTVFGLDAEEHQRLKNLIYELWSGPAASAPDNAAVLRTLREILKQVSCSGFQARAAFSTLERRVKSIFIHAFQSADTFDLSRVRRCCNAYPQPDGALLPACVNNVLRRAR